MPLADIVGPSTQKSRTHLNMESQLFPCLGILAPIGEETTESPDEVGEQAHFAPPTQFSTPLTAFTVRSQSARSVANCRRPTFVRK